MNWKIDINGGLRKFNAWFDEFILEVAKPLAILGFTMGTVDIYTRGGLATQPLFAVPWSVVQALTIDGLFFAVWWRFFAARWTRQTWLANIGLLIIGLVLSIVATATNMILGFQQLWGVSDSQAAMVDLGINPIYFTVTRATLVVVVTVMVSFTYFKSHPEARGGQSEQENGQQGVHVDRDGGQTITEVDAGEQELLIPETSLTTREAILDAWVASGRSHGATQLAKVVGIPRSTVRRHLAEIKEMERPKVTWGEDGKVDTVQFPGKQAVKEAGNEKEIPMGAGE